MSSIKLKHSGGNGVIIAAPSSNPASDRTLTVPSDADGTILTNQSTLSSAKLSGALPAISGASLTGISQKIRQFVYKKDGVTTNSSSGNWIDSVESGHNVDITPTASDSILLIQMHSVGGNTSSGRSFFLRMMRKINNTGDSTVGSFQIGDGSNGGMQSLAMTVVNDPPTGGWNTSHVVNYRMRFGQDGSGTARYDYTTNSILYVLEIAP